MKPDIYQRITDQIVGELEKGVRPWLKPGNAEHAAGRITRPLRSNGIPYKGINVLMLWSAAMEKGYAAPVWMTFKQASELKANVRKGEHGSLVVYADKIIRTEADAARIPPRHETDMGSFLGRGFGTSAQGSCGTSAMDCDKYNPKHAHSADSFIMSWILRDPSFL